MAYVMMLPENWGKCAVTALKVSRRTKTGLLYGFFIGLPNALRSPGSFLYMFPSVNPNQHGSQRLFSGGPWLAVVASVDRQARRDRGSMLSVEDAVTDLQR